MTETETDADTDLAPTMPQRLSPTLGLPLRSPAHGHGQLVQLPKGVSGNPSGSTSPQAELKRRLEKLVPKLGGAAEDRIDRGDTQMIIEVVRQLIGAPRQAVEVTAEPTAAYRELLAQVVGALGQAPPEPLLPAAEVRLLPTAKRRRRPKPQA